jgi:hypothetical protein
MSKTVNLVILDYDLDIEYDYQPKEAANYSYDSPYLGADERVEVTKVELCKCPVEYCACKNFDILELLSESIIEKIEDRILEKERFNRINNF